MSYNNIILTLSVFTSIANSLGWDRRTGCSMVLTKPVSSTQSTPTASRYKSTAFCMAFGSVSSWSARHGYGDSNGQHRSRQSNRTVDTVNGTPDRNLGVSTNARSSHTCARVAITFLATYRPASAYTFLVDAHGHSTFWPFREYAASAACPPASTAAIVTATISAAAATAA